MIKYCCSRCGEVFEKDWGKCLWCGGGLYAVNFPDKVPKPKLYEMLTQSAEAWKELVKSLKTVKITMGTEVRFLHKTKQKWSDGLLFLTDEELRKFLLLLYELNLLDVCEIWTDTLIIKKEFMKEVVAY